MSDLARIRTVLVGLAAAVLAMSAGAIFDRFVGQLPIAALPALAALAVQRRAGPVRAATLVGAVVVAVTAVVALAGGGFGDVVGAFRDGPQRLLTTEWPSPERPDLVGAVAVLLATVAALASELAGRPRWHLLPLAPVVVGHITVVALSAPLGPRLIWLLPTGVLFVVVAALRPGVDLSDRLTLLRGERRLIPIFVLAVAVAAAVSAPVALATRADPRRNEPAVRAAPLLDPVEATLALRALDPPIDVHQIAAAPSTALPARWRTAALENYDGQRWTPALTLRRIGRRLAPDAADALVFDVRFLDDDLSLVPLPGAAVTVDGPIETDADRTVVRLVERRNADEPLPVTARPAPGDVAALEAGIATRPVDESVTGLAEFASSIAGGGTVLEQLRTIEATMRDDFEVAAGAPGGGLQRALVDRFMRDTQRGTNEQFATAFVLLARALGVDARIATGFVTDAGSVNGVLTLTSADAIVWPEVGLLDGRWLAFDPVPADEDSDVTPPPEQPAVQTPAAAQPPIAPPPEPSDEPQSDVEIDDASPRTALSSIALWAFRVGVGATLLGLPLLAVVGIILGLKYRRRRRRLAAAAPADRVTGAWATATDRLVDAGLKIGAAATNGDIAASGTPYAGYAHRELHRLSTLASAVVFGQPPQQHVLADQAIAHLVAIESTMAAGRSRISRWRWQLSLRSLRRATRSPVH